MGIRGIALFASHRRPGCRSAALSRRRSDLRRRVPGGVRDEIRLVAAACIRTRGRIHVRYRGVDAAQYSHSENRRLLFAPGSGEGAIFRLRPLRDPHRRYPHTRRFATRLWPWNLGQRKADGRLPVSAGQPAAQFAGLSVRRRLPVCPPGGDVPLSSSLRVRPARQARFCHGTVIPLHAARLLRSGTGLERAGCSLPACADGLLPVPLSGRRPVDYGPAAHRKTVHDFHHAGAGPEVARCAEGGVGGHVDYGAAGAVEHR